MKKLFAFIKWLIIDIYRLIKNGKKFSEYGLTLFTGRQGSGKTVGMVDYLERMSRKYPDCVIVTNFDYVGQDKAMEGWRDIFDIRNGEKGVIFAIDEIQNEYNSNAWKDFPELLLNEITQQRKQRIKIVATSQVFTRVVKQLREQTYEVVECITWAGRWTHLKCYDAEDYNDLIDQVGSKDKKVKVWRKWRHSFIQTDKFRLLFDSYAKVERMTREQFIDREKRMTVVK